jgi:hypothetical protein
MKESGMRVAKVGIVASALLAALATLVSREAAADGAAPLSARLAGNTLSAVAFVPRADASSGGGSLLRLMFQAYLRPDGGAQLRVWDTVRNAYTAIEERRWSVSGSTLCIGVPRIGIEGALCTDVHIWGPRIAGTGVSGFAMLDGDLKPGNSLLAAR